MGFAELLSPQACHDCCFPIHTCTTTRVIGQDLRGFLMSLCGLFFMCTTFTKDVQHFLRLKVARTNFWTVFKILSHPNPALKFELPAPTQTRGVSSMKVGQTSMLLLSSSFFFLLLLLLFFLRLLLSPFGLLFFKFPQALIHPLFQQCLSPLHQLIYCRGSVACCCCCCCVCCFCCSWCCWCCFCCSWCCFCCSWWCLCCNWWCLCCTWLGCCCCCCCCCC